MAIPQGIQGHLHAVMPQEGMVVQAWEDLYDHLDWQPGGEWRAYPPLGGEAQQAQGGESALPVVDHGRLDRQECGHTPRAEADLQEFNDPPARLLFRRIPPSKIITSGMDKRTRFHVQR
jgi:hypothetical protein